MRDAADVVTRDLSICRVVASLSEGIAYAVVQKAGHGARILPKPVVLAGGTVAEEGAALFGRDVGEEGTVA